jgi:hypothetical protein
MSIPGSASPLFFHSSSSSYLNRTPSSAGNRRTFTFSFWVKRGELPDADQMRIFNCGPYTSGTGYRSFNISFNGKSLWVWDYLNTYNVTLDSLSFYRDPSAWYHIAVIVDTTQATSTDRVKIYVNGEAVTGFVANTYPSQNYDMAVGVAEEMRIGARESKTTQFFDGYLADFKYLDGVAASIGDLGEFDDNGVWQPIGYTGTYGTNGFHLPFSDNSTAAALGTDTSGNGNDWTVNNITPAGTGTAYRTLELSVNHASGVVSQTDNAFDATYIANYVNTSTWAITNTAWLGSYANGYAEARWIPVGGYAVTNSLRVYFGVYSNAAASSTLTVTYTDATTESSSQFTSGNNNWMTLFTASNAAGKTIQKIEISNPNTTNVQFGGFVIDDQIVETANTDTDSLFDSPTNGTQTDTGVGGEVSGNYATWNPLEKHSTIALANGNLDASSIPASAWLGATFATTSGKWYYEVTTTVGQYLMLGVADYDVAKNDDKEYTNAGTYYYYGSSGQLRVNGNNTAFPDSTTYTYSNDDVIGIAFDCDNGTVNFYLNGSKVGGSSDSITGLTGKRLGPALSAGSGSQSCAANFGQRVFTYTAPSGFKALCTANLDDPTIADGSTAMDVKLYTGTEATLTISGYNFAPDLVWRKGRQAVSGSITETPNNLLFDTVRGAGKRLISNDNSLEDTGSTTLTAFTSDGFTLGSSTDGNDAPQTYVAWAWDAGTSTVSNTDGTITSSVRANPSAGFSIVGYTGTGSNATVGHGLNAAPEMILLKDRNASAKWKVLHVGAVSGADAYYQNVLHLDTNESFTGTGNTYPWGGTAPTSSVFSVANVGTGANRSGRQYNLRRLLLRPSRGLQRLRQLCREWIERWPNGVYQF